PVQKALSYVFETIHLLKPTLDVPLIGFSGAPFTVASYFIDSSSHSAFERTQRWMQEDPASFHRLLEKIAQATIVYLSEQIRAGVDALQVFDSWASILNDAQFAEFSLPYLKQIVDAIAPSGIPVILFCRSSSLRAEALSSINPTGISFDWHLPMKELRQMVPAHIAVQGNLNPEFLKRSVQEREEELEKFLSSMRNERGFIVNLGHGVTPDIPFENVYHFVNRVCRE